MRNKLFISRLISVILLLSVFTAQYAVATNHYKEFQKIQKQQNETGDSDQTVLSQIQPESLIPSHHFHFDAYDIYFPEITFIFSFKSSTYFSKSLYSIHDSFFNKIFGHLIVTNAP